MKQLDVSLNCRCFAVTQHPQRAHDDDDGALNTQEKRTNYCCGNGQAVECDGRRIAEYKFGGDVGFDVAAGG